MLSLIAVIGKNRELGKDNALLWNIPGDLKRFRTITSGHPIIMGRKTFQSIGRPLPGRTNVIISKDTAFQAGGISVASSFDDALRLAADAPGSEEIFVIGGGSVYAQAIVRAHRLYLTVVDAESPADTFFPEYSRFTCVLTEETIESGGFRVTYRTLEP